MTPPYCIESIEKCLKSLGLPFAAVFARALVALLTGRKISLQYVANLMPGEQKAEANRQQLRRCLDHETLTQEAWAITLAALLPRTKWILALDRTEWKRGDTTVNLLVLAVVAYGCAVPLLWYPIPNPGASDTAERKALLSHFIALFGTERLRLVTADREFIGTEWIGWLIQERVPFRIRIKQGEFLTHRDGRVLPAWQYFSLRSCRCKSQKMGLWGLSVYVGGKYLYNGEYLIVISNEASVDLWLDYRKRWKIECLFQALKGRGFDLESCRVSLPGRLCGWFGFLALGLCWCLKVGQWLDAVSPLPMKKHGRRCASVFARGLGWLQRLLAPLAGRPNQEQFAWALQMLQPDK